MIATIMMARVYILSNTVATRQLDICPKAPRVASRLASPRTCSWVASKAPRACSWEAIGPSAAKRRSGPWPGAGSRSSPGIKNPAHFSSRREGGREERRFRRASDD